MDYLKMEFLSKFEEMDVILGLIKVFVQHLELDKHKGKDICCAISEALSNAREYAYPKGEGKILLEMKVSNNRKLNKDVLNIKVQDKGVGIRDVQKAMEPLYTTGDDDDHSGMGFPIMETFSDKLEVVSELGKGTTIKMKFNL